MSSRVGKRASRTAICLAALGLASAATPARAAAVVGAFPPAVPDASALAAAIVDEASAAGPLLEAPADAPPTLPAPAAPAAAEPATAVATAAPLPGPVAASAADPAPEAVPQPAVPAPQPQPEPPTVQDDAANVNVSIRIDSPGDDGAVTQVNVAVDAPTLQYQPEPPRYQAAVPSPQAPAANPEPPAASPAPVPPAEPREAWDWSWTWDCSGAALPELNVPAGAPVQSWSWNWNWNCGDDETLAQNNENESGGQYHAPTKQYRPVNINVAIRINSPGDNGPVVQTNVAVSVGVPAPPPVAAPVPAPPPAQLPAAEPQTYAGAAPSALASSEPAPVTVEALEPALEVEGGEEHDGCCPAPQPRGTTAPAPSVVALAPRPVARPAITVLELDTTAVARLELRVRHATTRATAAPRPQARPARRPAERRPVDLRDAAIIAHGALGLAPIGAPERDLPFAVVVLAAFAFAFINGSWALARSRPTSGADPDGPPGRPG